MSEQDITDTPIPVRAQKEKRNGVTRPKSGTATERVWQIADAQSMHERKPAKRKNVIDAYVLEGGNKATAATQYARWRRFWGLGRANESQAN